MSRSVPRVMVVSHLLPPLPSGQAVILYNLLIDQTAFSYYLVSNEDYRRDAQATDASAKLPATYYRLRSLERLLAPVNAEKVSNHFLRALVRLYNKAAMRLQGYTLTLRTRAEILSRALQIARLLRTEPTDLVIACTADLYNLPAACLACRWVKVPFAAYVFDDYINQWAPGFRQDTARRLEPMIASTAVKIFVPNEYIAAEYRRRYRRDIDVVPNLSILPDLDALDATPSPFSSETVNIVYTGSVYAAQYQAFFNLLAALDRLRRDDIKIHIYTSLPPELLIADGMDSPHIVFHEHRPQNEILAIARHADILFLPLAFVSHLTEVIRTSLPAKTVTYLTLQKPILVHAPADSFLSWYFREHECGFVVDSDDAGALAAGLERLIADRTLRETISERARQRAAEDFEYDKVRRHFIELVLQSSQ